jgi:choline dehydrogenase
MDGWMDGWMDAWMDGMHILAVATGFWYSDEAKSKLTNADPDIQFHFIPCAVKDHGRSRELVGHTMSMHVCVLRPRSRGYIDIRSADPREHPHIQPNYLTDRADLEVLIGGIKQARRLFATDAMTPHVKFEMQPGKYVQSDQDLEVWVRNFAETVYHPVGTCKMAPESDALGVVDDRLRVRGCSALRVVDASIMPTIVSANTNAPTIMIAEKAAQMIEEDATTQ